MGTAGVGLLAPSEFVPVAERTRLIIEVGRWVLDTACDLVARWRVFDPSCSARLAVNISGRHLMEGDLVADLDTALAASGADPGLLEFDLTESHLMEDVDRALAILSVVRRRGVTISVDDFGTGYSSMTYLRRS